METARKKCETLWRRYADYYFDPNSPTFAANAVLYAVIVVVVTCFALVNAFAHAFLFGCDYMPDPATSKWDNPLYPDAECYYQPRWALLGLSLWEADKGRRLMMSILCGYALGYERRSPDRPAGIKLMTLVALGSCCFTISSMFCFESSTSSFDTARVSAAVVSGVGFFGSAIIWKGATEDTKASEHQVHGLTTAASVWVAASIGIASGGALYFAAIYTTVLVVILLRFGPRNPEKDDGSSANDASEVQEDLDELSPYWRQDATMRATSADANDLEGLDVFANPNVSRSTTHVLKQRKESMRF